MTTAPSLPATESPDRESVVVTHPQRSSGALLAKRAVQFLFFLRVAPLLLLYHLTACLWGRGRAHLMASENIARIPGLRGIYARQAFYLHTLRACGRDVTFGWLSTLSMPEAEVGQHVYIGKHCSLGYVQLGEGVMLADGVQILSGGREHGLASGDQLHQDQPQEFRQVRIGRGAWIGAGAIIMADVGEHAVVGAGAVVTRPVPPRALAVGVPARVVRTLASPSS